MEKPRTTVSRSGTPTTAKADLDLALGQPGVPVKAK
jgi:hypothetical protein